MPTIRQLGPTYQTLSGYLSLKRSRTTTPENLINRGIWAIKQDYDGAGAAMKLVRAIPGISSSVVPPSRWRLTF
jgi:hypothetical protein